MTQKNNEITPTAKKPISAKVIIVLAIIAVVITGLFCWTRGVAVGSKNSYQRGRTEAFRLIESWCNNASRDVYMKHWDAACIEASYDADCKVIPLDVGEEINRNSQFGDEICTKLSQTAKEFIEFEENLL